MAAWNTDLMLAEITFDIIIEDLATGVLRTLFMKPNRLSHTTEMPTNAVVNTVTNATIPIAIKLK